MANEKPAKRGKSKAPIVVLFVISLVLTLGLIAAVVVWAIFGLGGKTTPALSEEETERAWQEIDATMIAAVLDAADPDGASVAAIGTGKNGAYFTATINGDTNMTFGLDKAEVWTGDDAVSGIDPVTVYASTLVEAGAAIQSEYAAHLDELGLVYAKKTEDMDGDGETETYYVVPKALKRYGELADGLDRVTVCVVMDSDGERTIVHSAAMPTDCDEVKSVTMDNGMVHAVYLADGKQAFTRWFASECAASAAAQNDTKALRRLAARYAMFMEDGGFDDVTLRLADVSDAAGQELLCSYRENGSYVTTVLMLKNGRLHELLRRNGENGSLFLVTYNGKEYLFDYMQELAGDYSHRYAFSLFRLDGSYQRHVEDSAELFVAANEGGGAAGGAFFDKVYTYLAESVVCHDPYFLKGSDSMQGDTDEQTPYLYISNCSTDKTGVIALQDMNSWLRLREGPSTSDRIVMFDSKNEVKQPHGSLVTVVMPHNTGDAENPVWLEINIRYRNQLLTGYSSQRFINTNSVRRLTVGERFTVTADTNQTGLTWTSSDPSVASINPTTGEITARKAGMILVTVTSPTGLQDSCLILIDDHQ
ncbi:MAG: Ig-like domain-containing protein [Clostridia bacterium]|nr:Ig-like domain-containing protein [Clostridia bacterium]